MTHEEKVKHFTIALNICGFNFSEQPADLLVRLYDLILEKQGKTDVESILNIKLEHEEKYLKTNQHL